MTVKVNFCDFWPGFESNNLLLIFLRKYFDIVIDQNPDYLFYSVYGNTNLGYKNCIKILFTGENLVPDFNVCDYALGFHYIDFGDRYMRFPLYVYYQWHYLNYLSNKIGNSDSACQSVRKLVDKKFCNFVYSNSANSDPVREAFFHRLCKYKKVDSGGKYLNNIGKAVGDKLQFIKDYKFTIAFENSSVPGYTTEKLLEPILANSIPVYYGNPLVNLDFNTDSFIYVKGIQDFDRAIEEIIYLDRNDELYLVRLNQQKFRDENTMASWDEKLYNFLNNIFSQSLTEASRRANYGYTRYYTEELMLMTELLIKSRIRSRFKVGVKNIINRYLIT